LVEAAGAQQKGDAAPYLKSLYTSMNIRAIVHLAVDDSGQDLVEYAWLTGMVGAGALVLWVLFSALMGFRYSTWLGQVYNAWEPCAPAPGVCP